MPLSACSIRPPAEKIYLTKIEIKRVQPPAALTEKIPVIKLKGKTWKDCAIYASEQKTAIQLFNNRIDKLNNWIIQDIR